MYKIGDYVVHKQYVCKITDIIKKFFNNVDYYNLITINDESLAIKIPVNRDDLLRPVMNKLEAEELIKKIPGIELIKIENDRNIDYVYKELISTGNREDLIKIIKTAYTRNEHRKENGKKVGEKDLSFLDTAEKILYGEMSIALNKTFDETKDYVIKKVEEYNK